MSATLPRLTPGRFTALWVVLRALLHLGERADREELLSFARRSGLRAGGLPISDGYALAAAGGFVVEQDDAVSLSDVGRAALGRCAEEEPTQEVSRFLASVLLLRRPPTWVAYWQGDPGSLDLVLPEPSREILRDAGLLPEASATDPETWSLWNALTAVPALDISLAFRAEVGREAERAVLEAERRRLTAEGFPSLAAKVRWVAQESAAYGFDVLSYCGGRSGSAAAGAPLAIEVKATASPANNVVSFFLTRHEWHTAHRFPWVYVIRYVCGVRPGAGETIAAGGIDVPLAVVRAHVPLDVLACEGNCRWETTLVSIPRIEISTPRSTEAT